LLYHVEPYCSGDFCVGSSSLFLSPGIKFVILYHILFCCAIPFFFGVFLYLIKSYLCPLTPIKNDKKQPGKLFFCRFLAEKLLPALHFFCLRLTLILQGYFTSLYKGGSSVQGSLLCLGDFHGFFVPRMPYSYIQTAQCTVLPATALFSSGV